VTRPCGRFAHAPGGVLAACTSEELRALERLTRPVVVRAGCVIVGRGDDEAACFVVVRGAAAVDVGGRRVEAVRAGAVFGWCDRIDARPFPATITASECSSLAVAVDPELGEILAIGALRSEWSRSTARWHGLADVARPGL
jgi:CRP-like cAMP-binding protein